MQQSVVDWCGGANLRLLWAPQFVSNVRAYEEAVSDQTRCGVHKNTRTAKLHAQRPLELAEDLGVRDGATRLIVLDDGGLLVDLLREVLLRHLLLHTRGLNGLEETFIV